MASTLIVTRSGETGNGVAGDGAHGWRASYPIGLNGSVRPEWKKDAEAAYLLAARLENES